MSEPVRPVARSAVAVFVVALVGALLVWNPFMPYTALLTIALAAIVWRHLRHLPDRPRGSGLVVAAVFLGVAQVVFVLARALLVF